MNDEMVANAQLRCHLTTGTHLSARVQWMTFARGMATGLFGGGRSVALSAFSRRVDEDHVERKKRGVTLGSAVPLLTHFVGFDKSLSTLPGTPA